MIKFLGGFIGYTQLSSNSKGYFWLELLFSTLLSLGTMMFVGGMPQLIALKIFHAPDWLATLANAFVFVTTLCVLFFSTWLSRLYKRQILVCAGFLSACLVCSLYWVPAPNILSGSDPRQITPSLIAFLAIVFGAGLMHNLADNARSGLWRECFPHSSIAKITPAFLCLLPLTSVLVIRPLSINIESGDIAFQHAYLFCGLCLIACYSLAFFRRIPEQEPPKKQANESTNPFRQFINGFHVLISDKGYRYYQVLQMILGGSNMIVIIPRAILIDQTFDGQLGLTELAIINLVIPTGFTFFAVFIWGQMVSKFGPIQVRIYSAANFALTWIVFYFGLSYKSLPLLYASAAIWGIAIGSGTILWRIGHTYFAQPEENAAYYAIHQGLTGIRGIFCGLIGLWAYKAIGPAIALIAMSGSIVASLGYIWLDKWLKANPRHILESKSIAVTKTPVK